MNKLYSYLTHPLALIVTGLSLRAVFTGSYPFGFDQLQIIENAQKILEGDLTLIGPRTGPANMFTGPLIYYLTALFGFFVPMHQALVITSLAISLTTGTLLYFLARHYLNQTHAWRITALWALSPLIIKFDRLTWNPNLTLIAAALVLFPLLKPARLKLRDSLFITLGVFLGYQAHFSGLLLLPLAGISLILRRQLKPIVFATSGLILTILPTVLFDYRHGWLNWSGLHSLIQNRDQVSQYQFLPRLFEKLYIIIETIGKLFFEHNQSLLIAVTGLVFSYGFISLHRQTLKKPGFLIPTIWFFLVAFVLSLYRESTPEYYFFILLPAMLYMISTVLAHWEVKPGHLIIPLAIYSTALTYQNYADPSGLTIKNQLQAATKTALTASQTPIKSIVYDTKPIDSLGLAYFIATKNIPLDPSGHDLHFSYPNQSSFYDTQQTGHIGIWLDPRSTPGYHFHTTDNYIIGFPSDTAFTQVLAPLESGSFYTHYQLLPANASPINLYAFTLTQQNRQMIEILPSDTQNLPPLKNNPQLIWQKATLANQSGYYLSTQKHGFFIVGGDPKLIEKIEIFVP